MGIQKNKITKWVVGMVAVIMLGLLGPGVLAAEPVGPGSSGVKGYYVSDKTQWEKLKAELRLSSEIRALNPNFAKSAVVLAYWGEKPSAGYSVAITDVAVQDETGIVAVNLNQPEQGALTASVITYPADARVVELSEFAQVAKLLFRSGDNEVVAEIQLAPIQTYTVRAGDSLWDIAKAWGRKAEGQIMDFVHQVIVWNHLDQSSSLKPGQKLVVPAKVAAGDKWQLEDTVFSALQTDIGPEVVGYGFQDNDSQDYGDALLWVLAASPRETVRSLATVRLGDPTTLLSHREVTKYSSTGPWVRNADEEIIADVRDVAGANVINYLSLSPDGRLLALGVRGYENMLLLWDCVERKFTEVARYPDELISKVVWAADSRIIAVELAGAWGRSRVLGYSADGQRLAWGLESRWPTGYNLADPRWLGVLPVLSFRVEAVGASPAAGKLTGEWIFDPADDTVRSARSDAELL